MDERAARIKMISSSIEGWGGILQHLWAIGTPLAVCISWGLNHSIGWAAWHGFFGWIYVIYRYQVGVY